VTRLHKPKAGFWIRLCVIVVYPTAGLLFRFRWRGLDRIPPPERGGVLVVANHVSQIDTFLIARLVWQAGRVPRFLVKSPVFGWPVVGPILRGAGQIPVYRGTSDAGKSLHDAIDALNRGEAVVIYPEGTTTKHPENWPMQGKTGVARLVLLCPDVPVVPVGQWGAHRARFRPGRLIRRRLSLASVGEPLDLSRFRGKEPTTETLRSITDEIMRAVRDEVAELRGEVAPDEFYVHHRKKVDRRS
jgi:1-acyl-sn-glycerol-3-phosphate acyltransferase